MRTTLKSPGSRGRVSIALILSYVVDWVVVLVAAAVGAVFSRITPNKRPFSVVDMNISFPHVTNEKISTVLLVVCGLFIPAAIIFLVTFILVPGPTVPKSTPKALVWRRKLFEWHMGWLGLGLALASAFLITDGMKNLFGKPRPDLLSRCDPDLANIANYAVGGYENTAGGTLLVSHTICRNTDNSIMNDGFRSFPSGHSSFSAAGLIYLSLFLASKLAITIPFLAPNSFHPARSSAFPSRLEGNSRPSTTYDKGSSGGDEPYISGHNNAMIAARNQAAAPPVYLLVIAVIPTFAAIYIASTRWSDFRHHGFDILFGFGIGTITAIFAFRYYHLPINTGAGWAWGPRSSDRAFWAGVGVGNYVGHRDSDSVVQRDETIEAELGIGGGNSRANSNIQVSNNGIATVGDNRAV